MATSYLNTTITPSTQKKKEQPAIPVSPAPTTGTVNSTPTNSVNTVVPETPAQSSQTNPATATGSPITPTTTGTSSYTSSTITPSTTPSTPTQSTNPRVSQTSTNGQPYTGGTPMSAADVYSYFNLGADAQDLVDQALRGEIHVAQAQNEIYEVVFNRVMAELQPQIGNGISGQQATDEAKRQAFLAFDEIGERYKRTPTAADNAQFPKKAEPDDVFKDKTGTSIDEGGLDLGATPDINYKEVNPADFAFSYLDFMPDIELTDAYQIQKEEGLNELAQLMAARGHIRSGFEVDENADFIRKLLSDEIEKHRGYADKQADRASQIAQQELSNRYGVALESANLELQRMHKQGEINLSALNQQQYYQLQKALADNAFAQATADRLTTLQIDAADRDERSVNRSFDNMMQVITTALSQVPIAYALQGTQGLAGAEKDGGDALSEMLNAIALASAQSRGGGGGGGSGYIPPYDPGGPDYSGVRPVEIQSDLQNSSGWANAIFNIFKGLL